MHAILDRVAVFEKLSEYFKNKPEIKLAVLYGSAAKGNLRNSSDIDIAVSGREALDRDLLFSASSEISLLLGREIDLLDLHRVEGLILYRIMTEGKRIKTDATLYVKFQGKALGYFEDFKPLQDMMRKARIERFINGS